MLSQTHQNTSLQKPQEARQSFDKAHRSIASRAGQRVRMRPSTAWQGFKLWALPTRVQQSLAALGRYLLSRSFSCGGAAGDCVGRSP